MTSLVKDRNLFREFIRSERSGGFILIGCTVLSLLLANSPFGHSYLSLWHAKLGTDSVEYWINDGLMTIFFLLIGLELEREVYLGELSKLKNALFPIFAATGGMLVPAAIYFFFNHGGPAAAGTGIPMATDIAFAIGILSLAGSRLPPGLKIFLTALAVIDDLGAILVIAFFYSGGISLLNLAIAMGIMLLLFILNRLKVQVLWPYLVGGAFMWYFMLHSGVHATITGVLLAFVIPFGDGSSKTVSSRLQHWLHVPVAFIILPLFALANTGVVFNAGWLSDLAGSGSLGIISGLALGKPLGVLLFCVLSVLTGIASLPAGLAWKHIIGAGMLAGIGFTMSIFITLLAFSDDAQITQAKIAILVASLLSALMGLGWLASVGRRRKMS